MSPVFYYILHVISLLVLTGYTFYAFAAPPESKPRVMMMAGIAGLLALIAGFGLQAKMKAGWPSPWPGWLIVKIVCWVGLMALGGIGYRRRGAAGALAVIAIALVAVAVTMVYTRPF